VFNAETCHPAQLPGGTGTSGFFLPQPRPTLLSQYGPSPALCHALSNAIKSICYHMIKKYSQDVSYPDALSNSFHGHSTSSVGPFCPSEWKKPHLPNNHLLLLAWKCKSTLCAAQERPTARWGNLCELYLPISPMLPPRSANSQATQVLGGVHLALVPTPPSREPFRQPSPAFRHFKQLPKAPPTGTMPSPNRACSI
jgi:hypothetical protein